jgi:hypothetical protein
MRLRHCGFLRPNRLAILLLAPGAFLFGGSPLAADCSGDPANILEHCGFQSSTDVTAPTEWILGGGVAPCFSVGTFSHDAADGSNSTASMVGVTVTESTVQRVDFCQCENSPPAGDYGYGIDIKGPTGLEVFGCVVNINSHAAAGCTGAADSLDSAFITELTGAWQQIGGGAGDIAVIPAATASVLFHVTCFRSNVDGEDTYKFDNAFLGIGSTPVELQAFDVE